MLNVEKFLHEVGLGVKGQSNLVIAGSPRNSFRASVVNCCVEVEHCKNAGPIQGYQVLLNSECHIIEAAVRLRVIRSVVKRETAQINS